MTRLYLVRHCEAEGNRLRRCHGAFDSDITPRGREQIDALMTRFQDIPLDAVYSSDLYRARETALALAAPKKLPVGLRAELRELHMGAWEDRGWGQLTHDEPDCDLEFIRTPHLVDRRITGGESAQGVGRRVMAAVTALLERHKGQSIAAVFHGTAMRSFLCMALGLPWEKLHTLTHIDNTGVSLLEWDGSAFTPAFIGDNSHLTPEKSTLAHQTWHKGVSRWGGLYLWFERVGPDQVPGTLGHLLKAPADDVILGRLEGETAGLAALVREGEDIVLSALAVLPEVACREPDGQLLGEALHLARKLGYRTITAREGPGITAAWLASHLFAPPGEGEALWRKRLYVTSAL